MIEDNASICFLKKTLDYRWHMVTINFMSFRLGIIGLYIFLVGGAVYAGTPCERLRLQPDAWVTARTDALIRTAKAAFENDEAKDAYNRVLDGIAGTFRRCKLDTDQGFASRYREFIDYIETASLDRLPGHELGFIVPDKQYFEETSELVKIPDFLLDPGFLRIVTRSETLSKAKAYLRSLNVGRGPSDQLIFFSYKSRHLGTPDNDDSYRRLLIVVPGDAARGVPEKWVQFGITDPGVRIRTRNVSVVSAMLGQDGTYNTYFKDNFRTYRRDGSISIKGRWELGYGDDNCASCHKSGVLPIFPVDGSVGKGEQPSVEAVNKRFRSYGSPRFDKYLDASKLGPGLSTASLEDRAGRFGKHFVQTDVAGAMRCANCHTPDGLGYLNWPMDQTIIDSFINGGQMPRGHAIRQSEREELYKKLIQEYFSVDKSHPGILKLWLLGKLRQRPY